MVENILDLTRISENNLQGGDLMALGFKSRGIQFQASPQSKINKTDLISPFSFSFFFFPPFLS